MSILANPQLPALRKSPADARHKAPLLHRWKWPAGQAAESRKIEKSAAMAGHKALT